MRTIYFDCNMGAAGDMLTAALLELVPDKGKSIERLNSIGVPGVTYSVSPSTKCGIVGTHVEVSVNGEVESEEMHSHLHSHSHEHNHDHIHEHHHGDEHAHEHDHEHVHAHDHSHDHAHAHDLSHDHDHDHDHGQVHNHNHNHEHAHSHYGMHDIEHITSHLSISEKVRQDVIEVYNLIAEAESHAHGVSVSEIHFHEVGSLDAIADVAAVCMLMEELSPDKVVASPIHVGSGKVRCAHGILPVPAPATAHILRDVQIYGGKIDGELCTPTGAALIKHFATSFGDMPIMKTEAIGYGMGTKDFEVANCIRAFLGETEGARERVVELVCNLDDMTGEAIAFAEEELLGAGAVDVFTTPIQMKKSRPAVMLTVLCHEEDRTQCVELIFKHTTTLGIRENVCNRYTLSREIVKAETSLGTVHIKKSSGYGIHREKPEYEDVARIAREKGLSIAEVEVSIRD